MIKKNKIDKIFFGIVTALVILGLIMFISASLGIYVKNENEFYGVIFSQFVLGFLGGISFLFIGLKIPYNLLKKYSLIIFIFSILLTCLVLIPGIGKSHGGARRWIDIFGYSFQPVEFLKIGFIIYFAYLLSWAKDKIKNPLYSILPFIVMLAIVSGLLIKQPDTKNIILLSITALVMLFVSGTSLKWIAGILGIIMISLVILVSTSDTHSYLKKRINTFINPSENAQSSSWQLQQCLIAVGSGGFSGRGLGQSIQKLTYLPEPQGDSIFCVIGEELGFLGSTTIIFLFLAFMLRGYRIALRNAEDSFGKLIVIGFITIITAQSFLNISAMIGVLPLTGVPLVFFSHGGTALLLSLFMVGIILNVSRGQIKTKLEKS